MELAVAHLIILNFKAGQPRYLMSARMKLLIEQPRASTNAPMKSSEISCVLIPQDRLEKTYQKIQIQINTFLDSIFFMQLKVTKKFCCCFQFCLVWNVLNIVLRLTVISVQRKTQMKNLIVESSRKIWSVQVSFQFDTHHLLSSTTLCASENFS